MIEARNLGLTYQAEDQPILQGINLKVDRGELVMLCGPTGCGKSSLLNCLNGILQHESSAQWTGEVFLDGQNIRALELSKICQLVGTVFQNPGSQLCTTTPKSEIAFGLENLALERTCMRRRIDQALDLTGLTACRHQPVTTLSGGQQQRLVIACALALQPKALLLDEPISQLDPQGAHEILLLIQKLKSEANLAVLLVEHRTEDIFPLADRVVLMEHGRIVADQTTRALLSDLGPMQRMGLRLPSLADLFGRLGRPERPLRPQEAPLLSLSVPKPTPRPTPRPPSTQVICQLDQIVFTHGRNGDFLFQGLDLTLCAGDRVALMGSNGSGKTSLLHLLSGLHRPRSGNIRWKGDRPPKRGLLMQVPDAMLFSDTVREEVEFAVSLSDMPRDKGQRVVNQVLSRLGLCDLADRPPFALSRGQRLRAAIGSVLSKRPQVLLLDEPTTGQDQEQIERMMAGLINEFELVLFCTHDVDTAARYANRVILLHAGCVVADGTPLQVLFDPKALQRASIRQTGVQLFGLRHQVQALCIENLLELVR